MQLKKLIILVITTLCIGQVVGQNRLSQSKPPFEAYPKIANSKIFMTWVEQFLDPQFQKNRRVGTKISYYKQVRINGSDDIYYLVEYNYGVGNNAEYPWKFQLLFTQDGQLVRRIDAAGFKMLDIFPGQNPFLLVYYETAKGNGSHSVYKISDNKLVNIYEGSMEFGDNSIRTVDNHEDGAVYEPGELRVVVNDYNGDGINDIAFVGKMMTEDRSDVICSLNMIFLFDPETGHFRAKEDYNKLIESAWERVVF